MPRLHGRAGDHRRHGCEDAYAGYRQHPYVRVRGTQSPAAGRTPWRCGKECGGSEHDHRAPAAKSSTRSSATAAPAAFAFRRYERGARQAAGRIGPRAQRCRLTRHGAWSGGLTVSWGSHLAKMLRLSLSKFAKKLSMPAVPVPARKLLDSAASNSAEFFQPHIPGSSSCRDRQHQGRR